MASQRQDVFGCGCVLYEMLEKRLCFPTPPEHAGVQPGDLASRSWEANNSKLRKCFTDLLAPGPELDPQCLLKVAMILEEWDVVRPETPSALERARRHQALDSATRRAANKARKDRRKRAILGYIGI